MAGVLASIPWAVSLTLLAALPSVFNVASLRVFEEEKALLLRASALLVVPGVVAALRWRRGALVRDIAVASVFLFVAWIAATTLAIGPTRDALLGAYQKSHGVVTWLALASLFAVMCHAAASRHGSKLLLDAIVLGSVWPAAYLLLQHAGVDPVHWAAPTAGFMAGSTFGNHVYIGGYLALVLPLTIARGLRGRIWFAVAALQLAAIIVAGSRGAWLACAGGLAVFVLVYTRSLVPRYVPLAVAGVGVALLLAVIATPSLRPKALDPSSGSARVRVLIWQGTATLLRDSGWHLWTGHGQESLRALFPRYYVAEIGRLEGTDAMPDRAHNEALDTLITSGIVGALLQLFMFGAACWAALRIADTRLSAGVTGAIVAHVIEIQFGVATVTARLALLAAVAIAVGTRYESTEVVPLKSPDASGKRTSVDSELRSEDGLTGWVGVAAVAGAAAPLLWVLPRSVGALPTRGSVADFVEFLGWMSYGTVIAYVVLAAVVILIASRIQGAIAASEAVRPAAAVAWILVAMAIAVPLSLTPSRADIVARAATGFEQQRQWQQAAIAFEEARRLQPSTAPYADGMGRALSQGAIDMRGSARGRAMEQAHEAFSEATRIAPHDADYRRHSASLLRLEAWSAGVSRERRDVLLREADDIYRDATERAPQLTSLWVEWARVDLDRRQGSEALAKLDRALQLDENRADARSMREEARQLPVEPAAH